MTAMAADVEDFDVEIDLPRFLNSVLEKAEYICQRNLERRIMEQHIVVVDQTVSWLRSLRDSRSIMDTADKEILSYLSSAFNDVFLCHAAMFSQCIISIRHLCRRMSVVSPTSRFTYKSIRLHRGRFAYKI